MRSASRQEFVSGLNEGFVFVVAVIESNFTLQFNGLLGLRWAFGVVEASAKSIPVCSWFYRGLEGFVIRIIS